MFRIVGACVACRVDDVVMEPGKGQGGTWTRCGRFGKLRGVSRRRGRTGVVEQIVECWWLLRRVVVAYPKLFVNHNHASGRQQKQGRGQDKLPGHAKAASLLEGFVGLAL